MAIAWAPSTLWSQEAYEISYSQTPETDFGVYDYLPVVKIVTTRNDKSYSAMLERVFNGDIRLTSNLYRAYGRAIVGTNGELTVPKTYPLSFYAREFYGEGFTKAFINCFNAIPTNTDKEIDRFYDAMSFIRYPEDVEPLGKDKIRALIADMKWIGGKITTIYWSQNRSCPQVNRPEGLDPKKDYAATERIISTLLFDISHAAGRKWANVTRKSFYDFWASEQGYWHGATVSEFPKIFAQISTSSSFPTGFIETIQKKSFSDFLGFLAEFRQFSSTHGKSAQVERIIGTSCLATVDDVFEPFTLDSCLSQNKLALTPSDIEGQTMIVKGEPTP